MRVKWAFVCGLCAVLTSMAFAEAPARVLIISIDGCRPDVALRADMPNLRALMREGSFTFWATTIPAAITLPSHTSMLTGVTIERHGVTENDDDAIVDTPVRAPTLFDLARQAGLSTGMAAGKGKFAIFAGSIDHAWYPQVRLSRKASTRPVPAYINDVIRGANGSGTKVVDDALVADHAIGILQDYQPRVMFVHFGHNDEIGHAIGWGTPQQVAGLAETDRQLGRIFDTLKSLHLYDATTIILSADHGGAGRWHGPNDDRSKFIPWIIRGPGVRADFDLSNLRELHVQTYDTFATACDVLHLKPPDDCVGKPIWQAYKERELYHASTTRPAAIQSAPAP